MKFFSLNGKWQLQSDWLDSSIKAEVPGSVYSDLLNTGKIPDPFWRDNEMKVLPLMEHDYSYSRSFTVPNDILTKEHIYLRCYGLDTLASIKLNGDWIGKADNMHRTWLFDVKPFLNAGENELSITFFSPTKFIREAYAAHRLEGSSDAMEGFPYLRKAHCMFGWDWGPRLPDCGIWRDIELIAWDQARIGDVHIRQQHEPGRVNLSVRTSLEGEPGPDSNVHVKIIGPDGEIYTANGTNCEISIENPRIWWPAGLGEQPLYQVEVELSFGEVTSDVWSKRIGLRTLSVCREKDPDGKGESFCHIVNGVKVFAMGADYIPEDNLFARRSPDRTHRLLEDARLANMNSIRVWGGGCYPDDWFYDICDELGLLVWQDFMFACAVFELSDEFEQNIRAEAVDNIRRLRHHPSLALWCGNNEMEDFVRQETWVTEKKQAADYIKMYEYIFPQILKQEDPDTFYWPSSPSSGGSFDGPNDPERGDVHYWAVWHGLKPFTDYRNYLFRYASEFGFQSFPPMATIESFTEPEDRNPFSYVMEKHQRNASANGRIAEYLSQTYLYPTSFDSFVYASQLLQAQAMQYGVEHWRRHRGHCMGAIVWQLNDIWPVVSWASIDYFGRWKALHYYEKRFFAPVLISCEEVGIISQDTNVNAEHFPDKMSTRLNVSNETREVFEGTVRWSLRAPDASVIESGSFDVSVPPLSAVWLSDAQDFSKYSFYDCYYSYELADSCGNRVGSGSVLFCAPKHFQFADPKLNVRVEGDEIVVTAQAYALSVEIQCGADVLLEDNFFDMNAGERRIKILRGVPEEVSARSVFDIR
ncbi:MAG: glycoside hydrolase family 2 protein [Anaerolineaceae bacterium]|nr:glycoside hydrolase family 2 protein [Anaerolineaceae bacterium]